MTATMSANGRARKSLADQIDRLDGMLDGLAGGLNEAVAEAVQGAVVAAVQEAVRAVLLEVVSNRELLDGLRGSDEKPADPASAPAGMRQRFAQLLHRTGARIRSTCYVISLRLRGLLNAGGALGRRFRGGAASAWDRCRVVRHFAVEILTATGFGVLAGVGAYYAGPEVAAVASGLGGFGVALALQAALALRHLLGIART